MENLRAFMITTQTILIRTRTI